MEPPTEEQAYREELERINSMGQVARAMGVTIQCPNCDNPPELNADGSLYEPDSDDE